MRNLKRALSLALASVMLLGMMVVGTGAAAYPDVAGNEHEDSIAVMQLLGVMTGDEKGNFNPDKPVTRNEMAVIMVNLMNLKLTGAHPFTDVPAWADKYVAAVYANNVTSGTSATTYGGDDTLTAAQAALMVMKTLGYFEYNGEFGDDWKVATVKKATELDLFDGIEANVDEAMTRAELAHLVYNALSQYVVVAHEEGGMTVEGNGITVTQKANYTYNKIIVGNGYETLATKLYDKTLSKNDQDEDDFGRPATTWTYDGDDVTVVDVADYVITSAIDEDDLYKMVGKTVAEYKGWNDENKALSKKVEKTYGSTADGVRTEIFVDDDNETVTVVYIYSMLAQVDKVKENKTDDEKVDVTLTVYTDTNGTSKKFTEEDAFAFNEDEWVIVYSTKQNDDSGIVLDATAAAKVVKDLSITRMSGTDITAAGTKYEQSAGAKKLASYKLGSDNSYDLYLDTYGYVIGSEVSEETAGDLVYVLKTSKQVQGGDDLDDDTYVNVKYVTLDGTTVTVKAAAKNAKDVATGWSTIKEDSDNDGWFKFTTAKDDADYKEQIEVAANSTVKASKPTLANNLVANNKTVFLLDDGDTIKVVTGIKNLSEYTLKNVGYGVTEDDSTYAVAVYLDIEDAEGSSKADDIVYIVKADGSAYDEDNDVTYYIYEAIKNGEITEIYAASDKVFNSTKTMYVLKTLDGNGYVKSAETGVSMEDWSKVSNLTSGKIENGVITFNSTSKNLADDVAVLVVDGTDVEEGTTADVKGDFTSGSVYFYAEDGEDISIIIAVDLVEKDD